MSIVSPFDSPSPTTADTGAADTPTMSNEIEHETMHTIESLRTELLKQSKENKIKQNKTHPSVKTASPLILALFTETPLVLKRLK